MFGRLKRRAEFLQVAAANRKWVAPGLILQVCRHSRSSETVDATVRGGDDILHPMIGSPAIGVPAIEQPATEETVAAAPAAVPMRVGFTASRKVGNAVKRNRARRRLKAAADLIVTDHGAPGHDIVLIARPATINRSFPSLLQDLTTGLKKMGAYRNGIGNGTDGDGGATDKHQAHGRAEAHGRADARARTGAR
ncbi:MAG: ribonuclease P protein component [Dongiaceae bacterium]